MPYGSKQELPAAVKKLPEHAQEIFRKAFNAALQQYKSEEKAFKVAWAAVAKYKHKDEALHHFDAVMMLDAQSIRTTNDGYLVASARVARTGIQVYGGHEVDDDQGRAQVRVYRPESEVFAPDSLHTFAHKPVTLHHPQDFVSADNWKEHAVGHVDGEIMRDGDIVRIPMLIADAHAIKQVRDGMRELSVGYDAQLDWTPGFTDSGEEYDAVQRGIRVNHIALTPMARGGPQLRIGDSRMDRETITRQIMCDGIAVTLPDQDAQIVTRALRTASERAQAATDALAPAQAEVTRLTTVNQTLTGTVAALEQKVKDATVTDADLDLRVTARQGLIAQAKKVLGDSFDPAGKSAADIRRAAVTLKLGDGVAKALTDAAIEGAFTAIVSDIKTGDGVRELGGALSRPGNVPQAGTSADAERAWDERGTQLREAWKGNNGAMVKQ